jgi:hypothetical protein
MTNPYPTNGLWIGDHYDDEKNPFYRALILGESTYDFNSDSRDPHWLLYFTDKTATERRYIDRMFGKLFRVDSRSLLTYQELYEQTPVKDLKDWFNKLAFLNLLADPLQSTKAKSATHAQLKKATLSLLTRLSPLGAARPRRALIACPKTAQHALEQLVQFGIPRDNIVIVPKHISRASYEAIGKCWEKFKNSGR